MSGNDSAPGRAGRGRTGGRAGSESPTTAIACTSEQTGPADSTTVVAVEATVVPASGRRRYAALIVRCCPFCGGGHLHRGAAGVRRAGCNGREYQVIVAAAGVGIDDPLPTSAQVVA